MSQIVIGAIVVAVATVLAVRRIVQGQGRIERQMREQTRLKKLELALYGAPPAVREPAADERDPGEILAEIEAGPYVPCHIRPDLPADVGAVRLQTPDGPVLVMNPRHRPLRGRRHGGTYRGLAAVPVLGAAWRTVTAFAQGTATLGGAAAAGIMFSPAPIVPPAMADQPPAVMATLPGRDVHQQPAAVPQARPPAAPGQPLRTEPPAERAEAPVPAPPARSTPSEPAAEPAPSQAVPSLPSLPDLTPTPSSSPTPPMCPSPSPTRAPTPSTPPTERTAPEAGAPTVSVTVAVTGTAST